VSAAEGTHEPAPDEGMLGGAHAELLRVELEMRHDDLRVALEKLRAEQRRANELEERATAAEGRLKELEDAAAAMRAELERLRGQPPQEAAGDPPGNGLPLTPP
jgi:hypothetical protein